MHATLILKTSDGTERRFPLRRSTNVIGRDQRCDIRVPVPTVDDRHCEIRFDSSTVELVDLATTHGTYRNGERVERAHLASDDELQIGPARFVVQLEPAREFEPRLDIPGAESVDIVTTPRGRPAAAGEVDQTTEPAE